ncbi:MAG: NADP-specific glutamate dehydrogenase [Erysipelotrichaceae bacterium]|jgi:glutamate dehydrogenase (NADP+)|nr:NADP-specific glutamate dehydrogenase [Erysipelotrichaceae bacterium]
MENNKLDLAYEKEFKDSLGLSSYDPRVFEAEHIHLFDVTWTDEKGEKHTNKGYRVQWNNKNGPYKGGLRFHPSVTLDLFKRLAFEQTFKNILTTLPMGGAKGGSDFDPHGKSDYDIKAFCEAFMDKLAPFIGVETDVPAGDIGVGGTEIRYLYERYMKVTGKHDCSLTGKPLDLGGSLCRKEATGYGLCYITQKLLDTCLSTSFKDKTVVISGSGNVAIYAAEKAMQLGAKVVAMSDSTSAIHVPNGIDLDIVKEIKEVRKGRIKEYPGAIIIPTKDIWKIKCDIALPCATQNEIDLEGAEALVANGCKVVCEGSNMSCTEEAVKYLQSHNIYYIPGKASNAGGVSVSGLEIEQNKAGESWSFEKVDARLKGIMETIFENIYNTAKKDGRNNDFVYGANKYAYDKLIEEYGTNL